MHSFLLRANALLTVTTTSAFLLAIFVALLSLVVQPTTVPSVRFGEPAAETVRATRDVLVEYDSYYHSPNHFVRVWTPLYADFSPLFDSWNIKLVQVQLRASFEYLGGRQTVVLWDTIIRSPSDAMLHFEDLQNAYALHNNPDYRSTAGFVNSTVHLDLIWCIMPRVGLLRFIRDDSVRLTDPPVKGSPTFKIPALPY